MSEIIKSNQELEIPWKEKMSILCKTLLNKVDGDETVGNNGRATREGSEKTFKTEHEFLPGIYMRRMIMKPESIVISLIHKRKHGWFLLKGSITVVDEYGEKYFKAPHYQVSNAGTQRVIYAHEKVIFQNVFKNPTDTVDLDTLEDYHYAYTNEEFEKYINTKIDD
jgi:hypothetical protein